MAMHYAAYSAYQIYASMRDNISITQRWWRDHTIGERRQYNAHHEALCLRIEVALVESKLTKITLVCTNVQNGLNTILLACWGCNGYLYGLKFFYQHQLTILSSEMISVAPHVVNCIGHQMAYIPNTMTGFIKLFIQILSLCWFIQVFLASKQNINIKQMFVKSDLH